MQLQNCESPMHTTTHIMPNHSSDKLLSSAFLGTLLQFQSTKPADLQAKMETESLMADTVVSTEQEYDRFVEASMPLLLGRASAYTKKLLKETNNWADNVSHEKLAMRLGYELLERFLMYARTEVPCRPTLLLDSYVAKHFSQPTSFVHNHTSHTPLETFMDGLISRAVTSRDALIAQFTHFYSFTPSQVIKLLGLAEEQSQRIYKNFTRWRQSGWHRTMKEIGLAIPQIATLEQELQAEPEKVNGQAKDLLIKTQAHYRKSEPDHYPCQKQEQWNEMFVNGYGQDYRVWHLSMCHSCLAMVHQISVDTSSDASSNSSSLVLKLQIQPINSISVAIRENHFGEERHGT